MARYFRKLILLAKSDVTYGTDPVPTGGANAMVAHGVELSPLDGEEVERANMQPYFGNFQTLVATQFMRLRFAIELAGGGAAGTAPKFAPLLLACAMSETVSAGVSVTYAPVSANLGSVTIYCNIDGKNHKLISARGNAKPGLNAKGKPVINFDFMGLFLPASTPVADTALPAPTYTGWQAPLPMNKANTTASLHGIAVNCSAFELDAGNQVEKRDLTGVDTVEITDRKSTGSITFEDTTQAVKDWVGAARAKTLGNLSIAHGTTAGNIVTISAAGTCELGKPSYGNDQGVVMTTIPLRFVPTSAGNDEWSIVFT